MGDELVSVIMSVYNEREEWIKQSIDSIINQTYSKLQVIIVLDNPFNDAARKLLLDYQDKDDRVQLVFNDENIGLVASLNKALQHVRGKYVARMDADDISEKNRIKIEMDCMREKNADFVMSRTCMIDEAGAVFASNAGKSYNSKGIAKLMRYGNISAHPTWLLKYDIYIKLGGSRELRYCEDYDFVMRALQMGYQCYCMGEGLVRYRVRESGISESYAAEQYRKARYIRMLYRKNKSIQDMDVEELNVSFGGESQNYNRALKKMKVLSAKLAGGSGICVRDAVDVMKNVFCDAAYRKVFIENLLVFILQRVCGE